jgi:putative transposase
MVTICSHARNRKRNRKFQIRNQNQPLTDDLVRLQPKAGLLNESLLHGLDHARQKLREWVAEYNMARPHSSLGYRTPAAYAAHFTTTGDRLRNADQLRRSPVAHTAPQGVNNAEALIAAG